jgi:ankyrin repeat protein
VKAAGAGDVEKVDKYLRGGIPINMKHSLLQYTALHASTSLQNDEITQHLLQAGADVTIEARGHETVMHSAARFGNITLAKELLKGNAEIKSRNLVSKTLKVIICVYESV